MNCSTWGYNGRNQLSSGYSVGGAGNKTIAYAGDDNTSITNIATDQWTSDQLGVSRKISGTTSYDYLRDLTGQHLGERTGTTRYYYIVDALGTVLEVTDSTGAIVNDYTYDAWGLPQTATGQTTNEIPFRFTGAQWLPSGSVYHLGARFYDPRFGHFTQPDPATLYDKPGMASRYAYAGDDPVSVTDPDGLAGLPYCSKRGGKYIVKGAAATCGQDAGKALDFICGLGGLPLGASAAALAKTTAALAAKTAGQAAFVLCGVYGTSVVVHDVAEWLGG